jgi:hypothetical protein
METSYLKLIGSRLANHLGLKMDEGYEFAFPNVQERNYAYVEIPVKELYNFTEEKTVDKGLRNQHLIVNPACTIDVKGHYRFEVHPNPELWKYGIVQGMYYLEPKDGIVTPGFSIVLRRDLELADIKYAVRIYMRS